VYEDINESLRILEISRQTGGGNAKFVVGSRKTDLADLIVPSARDLSTLQKSYQGVPTDANDSFSEQFERTSGGTDVAAEIGFFVPYGADLLDLRLRYQVGGMRSYAKAVGGGGGTNTASGGGSTSGSGGSTTPTSSSVSTPSGGGSTTPSGGGATSGVKADQGDGWQVRYGSARSVDGNTSNAAATIAAQALSVGDGATQSVKVVIFNRSGGSRTFHVHIGTSYGGTQVYDADVSVSDSTVGGVTVALTTYAGYSMYATITPGTTSSSSYDLGIGIQSDQGHDHSTPNHTHATPDHTHPAHTHTVTIGDHTHSTPNHQHTLPDHAHTLDYGIYESSTPATVRVYLDSTLITALNDLTLVSDFDLLPYVDVDSNGRVMEGWHTLEFKSATDGATGSVRGTIFARKFLSTEAA
jgi:hypothetical protein